MLERFAVRSAGAIACFALFCANPSPAQTAQPTMTYQAYGELAFSSLLSAFYAGEGRWRMCGSLDCPVGDRDWGADALTYTLYLRWQATNDPAVIPYMKALAASAAPYPAPCEAAPCGEWSDVPAWDAVAALREYQVAGRDPAALRTAQAAYDFVVRSEAFAGGACPSVPYQRAGGRPDDLKTLETTATAVKAALLLYQFTGRRAYLESAVEGYRTARRYFLDHLVPLYSVYVFDDGKACVQLPHRFFASVNGEMISNGLALYRATSERQYRDDAVATALAVDSQLSDSRGIFADLQAENDIVEPLVESMYELAAGASVSFARSWVLRNAAAAVSARTRDGTYGRFLDGPAPTAAVTAWQTNGGFALEIAAAALEPDGAPPPSDAWQRARFEVLDTTALPATVNFFGSGIALIGTLGEVCCQPGHARVLIDGKETFDRSGIWQNKSSAGRSFPNSVLFAWRWVSPGAHTIELLPGLENAKEGGSFLHLRGFLIDP